MISVIVPAYNRRETLGATLDSLLAQTHAGWEAIVVDDGSSDGTAELAQEYGGRDPRIRVHRQPNGGVSRARNNGLALASREWTFFLDADDWIIPETFERLLAAAAADPAADAVYGGYVRVDDELRELQRELPELAEDLFPLFARTCAISIHTCLAKTELLRRVGGFDESLVTCEDWDLWQRIARVGGRFARIPDFVAYYRMRVGSASGVGRRMLADGLLVIDRGHGEDPRLAAHPQVAREPLSRASRDVARTYFVCYTAGLEIARGNDARDMIDALEDGITGDVDPHGVAQTLFHAIPVGRATHASEWSLFPDEVHRHCNKFIEALGERLGSHWLAWGARDSLERLLLAATRDERPRRAGRWYLIDLDLDDAPAQELMLAEGIERLLCAVRLGERRIAELEIPVVDGWMPARALADAVAAPEAWAILEALFARDVYPGLGEEAADPDAHDRLGWTVFLRELWDRPSWSSDDFYADGRDAPAESAPHRLVTTPRVEVDLAAPLPALQVRDHDEVVVALTVAGAPLTLLTCPVRRGQVTAQELRRTILTQCGFELCRAVVREAIVLAPADATGTLHERLAHALAARQAADAPVVAAEITTIGRGMGPDGTAVSRWTVLPAAAAPERLALARRDAEPIGGPDEAEVTRLLAAPVVLEAAAALQTSSDSSLLRSLEFDRMFAARPDPWRYDSAYEQTKYEQTLSLVPAGVEQALELGCAEGRFTAQLAERVRALTAADVSPLALLRARARCAEHANVAFEQLDLFERPPAGPYDLIVCSELLYYAEDRRALARAVRALATALAPGGNLVTAHAHVVADEPHAPGFDWDVPFGAATIEQALLGTGLLELQREIRTPHYRVQRYARRRGRRLLPRLAGSHAQRTTAAASELAPALAARFLPTGGRVRREDAAAEPEPTTTRLPILMYHRVAPAGATTAERWRVHPDAFEAQLRHLRERGYQSVTFEQWRAAADRRAPLPARSVMVTFDDGYADFPDYALPLLDRYGFHATMFVVTDLVGATNAWDDGLGESLPLMDWPTLERLHARGVDVGAHSSLHRPLVALDAAELTRDLCRSRMSLQDHLGVPTRSLCYPFGLHDPGVLAIAAGCGFRYGVTTNEWHASFGEDLLSLPRVEVRGTDTLSDFVAKLRA
ncbi:MAG TPA: trifunctional glycosyltransferase/class I SAM-dependent methyltransferase/polysaccharide deacetylase [Conexibacter sp.]|nr:trifunctional glycosyltransferase/class I SAM-dependent methyltransferase/polysaccharide deacetylase [Conexibacter sp.]